MRYFALSQQETAIDFTQTSSEMYSVDLVEAKKGKYVPEYKKENNVLKEAFVKYITALPSESRINQLAGRILKLIRKVDSIPETELTKYITASLILRLLNKSQAVYRWFFFGQEYLEIIPYPDIVLDDVMVQKTESVLPDEFSVGQKTVDTVLPEPIDKILYQHYTITGIGIASPVKHLQHQRYDNVHEAYAGHQNVDVRLSKFQVGSSTTKLRVSQKRDCFVPFKQKDLRGGKLKLISICGYQLYLSWIFIKISVNDVTFTLNYVKLLAPIKHNFESKRKFFLCMNEK